MTKICTGDGVPRTIFDNENSITGPNFSVVSGNNFGTSGSKKLTIFLRYVHAARRV